MRKAIIFAVAMAAGFVTAAPALAAELKIGAVNPARISAEAPQADVARQRLEREFAPRDEQLSKMKQDLRELEEKLSRDGAVMSEVERRRLERDIVSQQREIRRSQDEFREDFNMRRNEELAKLQRRIVETIHQFAREQGYDLVVSDGVIYASDKVDITDQIIQRLEREGESAAP